MKCYPCKRSRILNVITRVSTGGADYPSRCEFGQDPSFEMPLRLLLTSMSALDKGVARSFLANSPVSFRLCTTKQITEYERSIVTGSSFQVDSQGEANKEIIHNEGNSNIKIDDTLPIKDISHQLSSSLHMYAFGLVGSYRWVCS